MAYLHEVDIDDVPLDTHATTNSGEKRQYVHDVVWFLYNSFKEQSITLKKWGLSLGFKVSQLRPFVEALVGEE